jgi:hypothetical protein
MKQHKHHDLIIAWAKGAKIQYLGIDIEGNKTVWIDCETAPNWYTCKEYRIKPKRNKMRDKILKEIKTAIELGDEELIECYGRFEEIVEYSDEDLLDTYRFLVGFRG